MGGEPHWFSAEIPRTQTKHRAVVVNSCPKKIGVRSFFFGGVGKRFMKIFGWIKIFKSSWRIPVDKCWRKKTSPKLQQLCHKLMETCDRIERRFLQLWKDKEKIGKFFNFQILLSLPWRCFFSMLGGCLEKINEDGDDWLQLLVGLHHQFVGWSLHPQSHSLHRCLVEVERGGWSVGLVWRLWNLEKPGVFPGPRFDDHEMVVSRFSTAIMVWTDERYLLNVLKFQFVFFFVNWPETNPEQGFCKFLGCVSQLMHSLDPPHTGEWKILHLLFWWPESVKNRGTIPSLKLTASLPLKMDGWKTFYDFLLGRLVRPICQGRTSC